MQAAEFFASYRSLPAISLTTQPHRPSQREIRNRLIAERAAAKRDAGKSFDYAPGSADMVAAEAATTRIYASEVLMEQAS